MKCMIIGIGATYDKRLPPILDSVSQCNSATTALINGAWFAAKSYGIAGPMRQRIYHAWLVLTGDAMAVQFAEDHFRMAKKESDK